MKKKGKITRRDFIYTGSVAAISAPIMANARIGVSNPIKESSSKIVEQEWRNRQPGMAYRQLGRTGMMISEIVNGGGPVKLDNLRPTEKAVEMGLNYLDTAPAYSDGESETAIGKLLSTSIKRDKVFLTTKVSEFPDFRNNLYKEIFDGLPSSKQEALLKKAAEMRKERGVDKPGYFVPYWPGQTHQMDPVYLCNAMMEEYGEQVEGNPAFEKMIFESLEGSLKRVGTDHFDILMCPHGCNAPEEVNNPFIVSAFEKLKKQGKVRFLGFTAHHDMANILKAASDSGNFDVAMIGYNMINFGFTEYVIKEAAENGMGIIAMKVARIVSSTIEEFNPLPEWRSAMLDQVVPGDMKLPVKAYLWALQNPNLSAVISDLDTEEIVAENLAIAGKKVDLREA
ncbi:aldo/keto reductase [Bacteroidota bacterium]